MNTLLLDRTTWDLLLDHDGNIAVASSAYAVGQDISSAVRVFQGECYYNTDLGLPYLSNILGKSQSLPVYQTQVEQAALAVPDVAEAHCMVSGLSYDRAISGAILFTTTDGTTSNVGL
ncbi:hypothetical protein ASY01nite_17790 [Acetobacter syzygii]|uniref:hypothetical protein n=1 Tax=Acetobacter syzygii TaxID=146476 RepID=UPI0005E1AEA5|nr:hypothetical protein [Acetobacter syzygii]GAN71326.1 hypothetical protein Absy_015_002 [Acetobacter syzygii]GBR64856.1 hypothetical protein AA0483_1570 [Acetobacter syzygii NRIC 0483]GEL56713.1 hypothetical protein ASY01nite_17790 [Acetobacter syzygii]